MGETKLMGKVFSLKTQLAFTLYLKFGEGYDNHVFIKMFEKFTSNLLSTATDEEMSYFYEMAAIIFENEEIRILVCK